MKVSKKDMDFTLAELVNLFTYPTYCFTADQCGHCKMTSNVISGPGWFCVCGEYNILPWHNHVIPHENPDLGPSRKKLHAAITISRLWPTWYGHARPDWHKMLAPEMC
jgi:hypothetical protein